MTFWSRGVFTTRFLEPAQATVKTLGIRSDYLVGDIPCIEFDVYFPRLESLVLRHIIFTDNGPGTPEHFLIAHRRTLKHFFMDECPIVLSEGIIHDRLWCQVWDHLREKMEVLETITVRRCAGRDKVVCEEQYRCVRQQATLLTGSRKMGYVSLYVSYGYTAICEDIDGEEEDDHSLERLRLALETRMARN